MTTQTIQSAISAPLERIRTGLAKEGADVTVEIDEHSQTVNVTLVRGRIVCEGCLLPENLVRTLLVKALAADPESSPLRYGVATHDWAV